MKLQAQSAWRGQVNGAVGAEDMSRRERRGSETRERLFSAAMDLFRERGFHNTTVEDITNAADVGKGTFFNYFPSKEHILSVLGQVQVAKYDKAAEIAQSQNARAAIHWLFHAIPAESGSSVKMVRSLFTVFLTSEAVRDFLTAGLATGRSKLEQIFSEGQRRREIPSQADPADLAVRFQQSLFGCMFLWTLQTLQTPPPPLEKWLDDGFDFFWSGVNAPPAVRSES